MARIPYPDLTSSPPHVRDLLARLPVPANIFRMLAHAETCLAPVMQIGSTVYGALKLDAKLRELCILHAVKLEGGRYEWVQHMPVAKELGASDAQVDALERGDDAAACFSPLELAALRFAREVVVDAKASATALAEVREHLSDREVVELLLVVGFYMTWARLTETLDVDLDPPSSGALIAHLTTLTSQGDMNPRTAG